MLRHLLRARALGTVARPAAPAPEPLARALADLSSLPEVSQAARTSDASLAHTLLHRLLGVFPARPSTTLHCAVLHSLLAKLHHRHASLSQERHHRLRVLDLLRAANPPPDRPASPHLASAHLALALACLRGHGPEPRLAAAAPAASAQALATQPPLRTAAALLVALASEPSGPTMTALLSALVALDASDRAVPDVPGFARLFLALHGADAAQRVDHAKALVVRWEHAGGFDYVEALCAAADVIGEDGDRDMAEDLLTKAVRVAGETGNQLDKSEPLLRLARLYEGSGRPVEAEGLYRAIEERFAPVWEKRMFTVASADVYSRTMERYGDFLSRVEFNGKTRGKEGEDKMARAREVRGVYPEVLGGEPCVPLWVVGSVLPHFELPEPEVREE